MTLYNVTVYYTGLKINLYGFADYKLITLREWSEGAYFSVHKFSHEGEEYVLLRDELVGISYKKL